MLNYWTGADVIVRVDYAFCINQLPVVRLPVRIDVERAVSDSKITLLFSSCQL